MSPSLDCSGRPKPGPYSGACRLTQSRAPSTFQSGAERPHSAWGLTKLWCEWPWRYLLPWTPFPVSPERKQPGVGEGRAQAQDTHKACEISLWAETALKCQVGLAQFPRRGGLGPGSAEGVMPSPEHHMALSRLCQLPTQARLCPPASTPVRICPRGHPLRALSHQHSHVPRRLA